MPVTPFTFPSAARRARQRRRQAAKRPQGRRLRFESLESRRLLAAITGRLVYDMNADGLPDVNEPGLEDWRVYIDQNNNGRFDEGEIFSWTDADGVYRLEDVPTGYHVVAVEPQEGWFRSYPPGTGRWTVPVLTQQEITGYDFAQQREFTPFESGNLLLTRSSSADVDFVLEYTLDGELVQALVIPNSRGEDAVQGKDLVLDSRGRVQIVTADEGYRLTRFDPETRAFTTAEEPVWDLRSDLASWGNVAAVGNFVFVNEHEIELAEEDPVPPWMGGQDDPEPVETRGEHGLIRFHVDNLEYERFSDGFSFPIDVTVGLDGLLYTLNAASNHTTVQVHNPTTMNRVRSVNIGEPLRALAVDGQGEMFAITPTGLKHFSAEGELIRSKVMAVADDLVIHPDGVLALSSKLRVDLIDTDLSAESLRSIRLPGNAAVNRTSFVTFVMEPVSDIPAWDPDRDYGALSAGNILVSNGLRDGEARLYEFTPLGQLVQEFEVPQFEPGGVRDVVVTAAGDVYLYNGTFQPRLSRFDPTWDASGMAPLGFTDHHQFAGWRTADDPAFGGLATYGAYVFASDTKALRDTPQQQGIVRYDTRNDRFERFHADKGGIIDVTVGRDGLLYTLGPAGGTNLGTVVRRYHPVTMQWLGSVNLPQSHRAIAVDANGDLFAVSPEFHHYNRQGVLKRTEYLGLGRLSDMDLDADGRLLIAAQDGRVLVTDRQFTARVVFTARDTDGWNFASFIGPTRGSLQAVWDAFSVPANSTENLLDVQANDVWQGAEAVTITAVGPTTQGGTVELVEGGVRYDPPAQFVGIDNFPYTLTSESGRADEGWVQVTVEGTGNFFALDNTYQVEQELLLEVPVDTGVLSNDGGLDIFPELTPGNILITHSPLGVNVKALLQEYQPDGTLVRSLELPDFSESKFGDVRDLVVDRRGLVRIFNGTLNPRLTTYDAVAETLTHLTVEGWSTASNATFGGLTAWRDFVYAPDQRVGGDGPGQTGIIRFDIRDNSAQRFHNDGDFIDLNVGLDGLLYALGPGGPPAGQYIRVFNPQTMQLVRQINLPQSLWDMRAITVDAQGQIYAVRSRDPRVYQLTPNGVLQRTGNTGQGDRAHFSDIDLHENGRDLLIANINFSKTSGPLDADVLVWHTGLWGWPTLLQAPDTSSNMKFAAWVQPPVGALNRPLTVRTHSQPDHGTLQMFPDGSFEYQPDPFYSGRDQFTYVVRDAGGFERSATVSIDVLPINDRPELTPAEPRLTADQELSTTFPLTAIINAGPGTTRITDPDPNDPLGGVALVEATGQGVWSYSTNGTIFVHLGTVSPEKALLLPATAYLRFTPAGTAGGEASLTYHAWDQTENEVGQRVRTSYWVCSDGTIVDPEDLFPEDPEDPDEPEEPGFPGFPGFPGDDDDDEWLCPDGEPPQEVVFEYFSEETDTVTLEMAVLNRAPILLPSSPLMGVTDENTPFSTRLDAFVTGISDPDTGLSLTSVAVTGVVGNGLWEYSLDGVEFLAMPPVEQQAALLLTGSSYVRYVPDGMNGEIARLTYRGWDQSDELPPGSVVDVSLHGGITPYSQTTDTARLQVEDVNDAPVLDPSNPRIGVTDMLTPLTVTVRDFLTGITDVDLGDDVFGLAITEVRGAGSWQYSLDGQEFTEVPAVSVSGALLVGEEHQLRYFPDGQTVETAEIRYRAWDRSAGQAGEEADTSESGGETPFSMAQDVGWVSVVRVNLPPQLSGPTDDVVYTENDPPLRVFSEVEVDDPDTPVFGGGSLSVELISGGSEDDRLSIEAVGGISLSAGTVRYNPGSGPQPIGVVSQDAFRLTVSLTSPHATLAAVQALARAVAYANVSNNPSTADRVLELTVIDGDGGNDTAQLQRTVQVVAVNDPPVAVGNVYFMLMDRTLEVPAAEGVLANDYDPEDDPLTASLLAEPLVGDLTLAPDGSFVYQPPPLFFGLDVFTYRAYDGQAYSVPATVVIEVGLPATNPTQPGDVNADGWLSAADALWIANFLAEQGPSQVPERPDAPPFLDVNGDGWITAADVARVAEIVEAGGPRQVPAPRLEFPQLLPELGTGKFAQLRIQASDAEGQPLASIPRGQTFYVDVWVQDLRPAPLGVFAAYVDLHYNPARLAAEGSWNTGQDYTRFPSGDMVADGVIRGVGGGRLSALPGAIESLLLRLPFQATQRGAASLELAATNLPAHEVLLFGIDGPIPADRIRYLPGEIFVSGPPLAVNDVYSVREDQELLVSAEDGVLSNDVTDGDQELQAQLLTNPKHGQLWFESDGSFRYVPNPDFFGTDGFTYRADDGLFQSAPATVTIRITAEEDAPIAVDDRYSVLVDQTLSVPPSQGVLANDFDPDGLPLEASLEQGPVHGELELNSDGSFDYTPDAGFAGQDSFTYVASNGLDVSAPATVTLDVVYGWQNPHHPRDVRGNGWSSPLDLLLLFNHLERRGGGHVLAQPPVPPEVPPPFLDVTGDGTVGHFDAAVVRQDLAQHGSRQLPEPRLELEPHPVDLGDQTLVHFRLETTDAAGQAATQFAVGETFYLTVYVQDLREQPRGVFSAFVDIHYDPAGLSPDEQIVYGEEFLLARGGQQLTPGRWEQLGGARRSLPQTVAEQLLFTIPLQARGEGSFELSAAAAEELPAWEVTLAGWDVPVPSQNIGFGQIDVTLQIIDTDGDGVPDAEEDGAPFDGDGNQDGIPDRYQSHVASVRSVVSQKYVTLVVPEALQLRNVRALPVPEGAELPPGVDFPHGLFEFQVEGLAAGEAAVVTFLLESGAEANTYYRWDTATDPSPFQLVPHLSDGITGTRVFADRLELRLVDGQRGDEDQLENGVLVHIAAPGWAQRPWQNPVQRFDVTNDDLVTPQDALALINQINRGDIQQLPLLPPAGQSLPPFWDVNGDGWLTAADVLDVINHLNAQARQASGGEGEAGTAAWLLAERPSSEARGVPERGMGISQDPPSQETAVDRVFAQYDEFHRSPVPSLRTWRTARNTDPPGPQLLEQALLDLADELQLLGDA